MTTPNTGLFIRASDPLFGLLPGTSCHTGLQSTREWFEAGSIHMASSREILEKRPKLAAVAENNEVPYRLGTGKGEA